MRVLIINSVCGIGSTGRICTDLAKKFENDGHEVKIAYGRDSKVPQQFLKYAVRIGTEWDTKLHAIRTRILDMHGFSSKNATRTFLKWADEYNPDMVWLHNIHGYFINVEMLFAWIKSRPEMQVRWTLHDCWAFTGHCAYFTMAKCEQWKEQCRKCKQKGKYPASYFLDNCKENFERKRKAFTGVKNMRLITPSKWLADLTRESYLKEYPVEVCYNTVDKNVFKPTPSDLKERWGLGNKKIVLGVASTWDERKGLQDFYELSRMLDENYAIVLVGLSEKQITELPKNIGNIKSKKRLENETTIYTMKENVVSFAKEDEDVFNTTETKKSEEKCRELGIAIPQGVNYLYKAIVEICGFKNSEIALKGVSKIICVPRTNSPEELAEIYTMADIFANPTYEDNYPTVNLEALACGTKVITYDVGGAKETIE